MHIRHAQKPLGRQWVPVGALDFATGGAPPITTETSAQLGMEIEQCPICRPPRVTASIFLPTSVLPTSTTTALGVTGLRSGALFPTRSRGPPSAGSTMAVSPFPLPQSRGTQSSRGRATPLSPQARFGASSDIEFLQPGTPGPSFTPRRSLQTP